VVIRAAFASSMTLIVLANPAAVGTVLGAWKEVAGDGKGAAWVGGAAVLAGTAWLALLVLVLVLLVVAGPTLVALVGTELEPTPDEDGLLGSTVLSVRLEQAETAITMTMSTPASVVRRRRGPRHPGTAGWAEAAAI
jgi:hypothetical protein